MTPKEQLEVNKFANSIANLLVNVNVINFNMNLKDARVKIDLDKDNMDTDLLEKVGHKISQLSTTLEKS